MRRAEVFRSRPGRWAVYVWDGEIPDRGARIRIRNDQGRTATRIHNNPTHAAALAHALAEVGLAKKEAEE